MEDQNNGDHLNSSLTDLMTSLMVIFILLLLVFVHRTAGKDAAVTDVEEFERGAAEHGNVGGWSASDSRKAVAARRHSRAPSALRAATCEPSSPLSARTFWVASASSLRKRPGSQI